MCKIVYTPYDLLGLFLQHWKSLAIENNKLLHRPPTDHYKVLTEMNLSVGYKNIYKYNTPNEHALKTYKHLSTIVLFSICTTLIMMFVIAI